jgi:hypothetical protein
MSWDYPDDGESGGAVQGFIAHGWTPVDGRVSAERLADGYAMGIKLAGKSGTHRVACAIVYNGKVYFGKSFHGLSKGDLPDNLKGAMKQRSSESHSVSNCAEVQAMARAVNAGYDPDNMGYGLEVHACRTDNGEPMAPCSNCVMLLGLATCTSSASG